jgi:hypothetical protein
MHLDDDRFLARFASRDLGPEHFDHRGHLRMAWLHLTRYGRDEASQRVCAGIRALATQFGVPGKFNHTLTAALMHIMANRLAGSPDSDFDAFLAANPDLLADARGLLARHYSDERLDSEQAHAGWIEPDRAAID